MSDQSARDAVGPLQRRGRVPSVVLALILAVTALFAMPSSADAVIHGNQSTYGPWAVRMLLDGKPLCTGTAISDRWIISASHCFFESAEPVRDSRITFLVGSLDVRKATLVKPIAGSRVESPSGADVMMIKVQPMTNVTPAKLSIKKVKAGQQVQVFGWGATCTNRDENDCQSKVLRQATLKVLDVKKNKSRCFGFATVTAGICATKIKGEPAGGDSGAPTMTIAPHGKERLAGVFFGSDRDSMIGAETVLTDLAWIRATLKK
jgi:secreted trypsin-like serine protease